MHSPRTAAGGEIDVLDPAGNGTVTITKAISIVNDGVGVAAIGASSGNAFTITAGAGDSVHLRGLTIEGKGSGAIGIQFYSGGNLAIENCVIRNVGAGIFIVPSTSSSFSVSNTIASNNPTDGILVHPSGSAIVTGVLSEVIANYNNVAIWVDGRGTTGASLNVTIVDNEASSSFILGVEAFSSSGHPSAAVMPRNFVASNNNFGLEADSNAILRVAHSVVTRNGTGLSTSGGGILNSYGDNDINGNTNDGLAALTTIPTH